MTNREQYSPGPATGVQLLKPEGNSWTLILVRTLSQPPEKVWRALTEPAELREWAPFDADQSLGTVGNRVQLTTVGAPSPQVTESTITKADAPRLLQYKLSGAPIGRFAGMETMKFEGWQRLNAEYAKQFGIEPNNWSGSPS